MSRRCKCGCKAELPSAARCKLIEDPIERLLKTKGYVSDYHATAHAKAKREAKEAKLVAENKAWQEDLNRRIKTGTVEPEKVSDWLKKVEKLVNKYVRLRDKGKPCISCDWPDDGSNVRHASHFRSVGACSSLRFNTWNIHGGCAQCNKIKSGNISEYRPRLIEKIGINRVDWIECQPKQYRHELDHLKKMYKTFKKLIKREEKRINNILND